MLLHTNTIKFDSLLGVLNLVKAGKTSLRENGQIADDTVATLTGQTVVTGFGATFNAAITAQDAKLADAMDNATKHLHAFKDGNLDPTLWNDLIQINPENASIYSKLGQSVNNLWGNLDPTAKASLSQTFITCLQTKDFEPMSSHITDGFFNSCRFLDDRCKTALKAIPAKPLEPTCTFVNLMLAEQDQRSKAVSIRETFGKEKPENVNADEWKHLNETLGKTINSGFVGKGIGKAKPRLLYRVAPGEVVLPEDLNDINGTQGGIIQLSLVDGDVHGMMTVDKVEDKDQRIFIPVSKQDDPKIKRHAEIKAQDILQKPWYEVAWNILSHPGSGLIGAAVTALGTYLALSEKKVLGGIVALLGLAAAGSASGKYFHHWYKEGKAT